MIDIKVWGAPGGGADCTAKFQGAILQGPDQLLVPADRYGIRSELACVDAVTIEGRGFPGDAINGTTSILESSSPDATLAFRGYPGSTGTGSGGGATRLLLRRVGSHGGTAILARAESPSHLAKRLRFRDLQIEAGSHEWDCAMHLDGLGDPVHGIHDVWLESSRLVGPILIENGRNIHLTGLQLTGANGHLTVMGATGAQSSAVYITDVTGYRLTIDEARGVIVVGGSWVDVTLGPNAHQCVVHPGIVANPPVLGGTQNHFAAIVDDLGTYYESMS
jgi:hypothetical protein